ncbi:hypothetical protein T4D_14743 [Trichinella pseudospiralis]|uniref:Uncharacterized protein n=1 Tax=Trichinella pseudospiralis TaxID=6337 RepID=A0A0V1G5I6_TRIPS|nr:hypothetical protein T4D_14743 [Trichinella pseudospiralis]
MLVDVTVTSDTSLMLLLLLLMMILGNCCFSGCSVAKGFLLAMLQQVDIHATIDALHRNVVAEFKLVRGVQSFLGLTANLDPTDHACRVHPTADVDRIAPDIVVELGGANHAGSDRTDVEADLHPELKAQQVFVEIVQRLLQRQRKLHQLVQMAVRMHAEAPACGIQAGCGHVRRTDGFDLLHLGEFGSVEQFVKIADQLVQDAQKFPATLVCFLVHVVPVDHAGKQHRHHGVIF